MSTYLEIQLIAVIVGVACALPGVFLVLRRMAMMSDAISHTVLLGIVLGFFAIGSLESPLLVLAAAAMGVITVSLVELLLRTRLVRQDAAIGLVFPALFSVAVILISRFARGVHLDVDAVLLGELAFAPLDRVLVAGLDLPRSLVVMGVILLLNVTFIALFYKELKLTTFDAGLAVARMVGHITYLSEESMHQKFGRKLRNLEQYGYEFQTEFEVESYLKYNGLKFTRRFDANSYLYITRAMDYFDLPAEYGGKLANVIFAAIQDRRERNILSVRDQNTFDPELRQKRLMTLIQLWLIHRYRVDSVHYVTPTDDNEHQTEKMKEQGLFTDVNTEVGQIIVADVNATRVAELLAPDRAALGRLIRKEG